MSDVLVQMTGICKSFPGVKALDNAQLTLHKGEILGLLGENGAGKSTLMNCLGGIYKQDEGPKEDKQVFQIADQQHTVAVFVKKKALADRYPRPQAQIRKKAL